MILRTATVAFVLLSANLPMSIPRWASPFNSMKTKGNLVRRTPSERQQRTRKKRFELSSVNHPSTRSAAGPPTNEHEKARRTQRGKPRKKQHQSRKHYQYCNKDETREPLCSALRFSSLASDRSCTTRMEERFVFEDTACRANAGVANVASASSGRGHLSQKSMRPRVTII